MLIFYLWIFLFTAEISWWKESISILSLLKVLSGSLSQQKSAFCCHSLWNCYYDSYSENQLLRIAPSSACAKEPTQESSTHPETQLDHIIYQLFNRRKCCWTLFFRRIEDSLIWGKLESKGRKNRVLLFPKVLPLSFSSFQQFLLQCWRQERMVLTESCWEQDEGSPKWWDP